MISRYDTVTEALEQLRKKGYKHDFNLQLDAATAEDKCLIDQPHQFKIVESHRFEGASNPADNAVLYVIESKDEKIKGTLLNAYGTYSNDEVDDLIKSIEMDRDQ